MSVRHRPWLSWRSPWAVLVGLRLSVDPPGFRHGSEEAVEIVPGVGLPMVRLRQTLEDIEAVVGPAEVTDRRSARWEGCSPPFGVYFDAEATCDLIEVYASDDRSDGVTLGGVALVGRPMDEVVQDLDGAGLAGRRTFLTVDYDEGFTLWSLDEVGCDADPEATELGAVVEGVAIGNVDRGSEPAFI